MNNNRIKKGKSLIDFPDNYVVFDIETTGLDPRFDEIIEIGAIKVINNEVVDVYNSLIKPNTSISPFISNLTHITNDLVKDMPTINEVLPEFIKFLGNFIIIGHNVNFDINFTYDVLKRENFEPISNDFVDTLRLSRIILPQLKNHTLDDLTSYYEINDESHHRALADCYMTLDVLNNLKKDAITTYENIDNFIKINTRIKNDYIKSSDIKPTTNEFDKTSPFYNKNIVITGEFNIKREELMQKLVDKGAYLSDYVTNNTDILLLGKNKTSKKSSKLVKAEAMKSNGHKIKIIKEEELKVT